MKSNWNHLQKAADNLGDNLNAEAAWERFELRRKSKKRRFIFWWPYGIIGGIFLLGLLSLSIHLTNNKKSTLDKFIEKTIEVDHSGTNSIKLSKEENVSKFVKHISDENQESLNPSSEHSKDSQGNKSLKPFSKPPRQSFDLKKDKNIKLSKNQKRSQENSAQRSTQNPIVSNSKFSQNIPDVSIQDAKEQDYITHASSLIDDSPEGSDTTDYISNKLIANSDTEITKTATNASAYIYAARNTLDIIKVTSIKTSLIPPQNVLAIETYIPFAVMPAKQRRKQTRPLAIQARYIYGFAHRKIKGEKTPFQERRDKQENFRETNTIELLLSKEISPNLSISSGISLNQYRAELFEVQQELIQNISYNDVLLERRIKDGVIEEFRGEFIGSQTIITERIRIHQYIDLSIPIYIQYEMNFFPKLNISIATGVSLSPKNIYRGDTFTSSESQGEFQSLSELNYRKYGSVQGLFNIAGFIDLGNHLKVQLGGHLKQDLNHRIKYENNTSESFGSIGILLGVQKRF